MFHLDMLMPTNYSQTTIIQSYPAFRKYDFSTQLLLLQYNYFKTLLGTSISDMAPKLFSYLLKKKYDTPNSVDYHF